MMVKIEGYDFSNCVVEKSYQINRVDVYKEWTDSNNAIHRNVTRSKVRGSLTLHLRTVDDADALREVIRGKIGKSAYYRMHLDVNNTGEKDVVVTAVITATPTYKIQGTNETFEEFVLAVEER